MTIEKIQVHLSPDMGERIAQAKHRDRYYVFHIDAQSRDFGFVETYRTCIFDLIRMTHSDWVDYDTITINGKTYTIVKGVKGDDDPDYKLTAIDKECNPRICESFAITGREGKEFGLTREDMDTILSRMRTITFDDGLKCEVLVID